MIRIMIFIFFIFGLQVNLLSQDELLQKVHKVLDENERIITALRNENVKLKEDIRKITEKHNLNEKKLKKKLQELYSVKALLKAKENQIVNLLSELEKSEIENEELQNLVEKLKGQLQELRNINESTSEYIMLEGENKKRTDRNEHNNGSVAENTELERLKKEKAEAEKRAEAEKLARERLEEEKREEIERLKKEKELEKDRNDKYKRNIENKNLETIREKREFEEKMWRARVNEIAKTKEHYDIIVKNECNVKIKVYIFFYDLAGNWITDGYWTLSPNEEAFIAESRVDRFYTYAISIDGNRTWGGSNEHNSVDKLISSQSFTRLVHSDKLEGLPDVKCVSFSMTTVEEIVDKFRLSFTCPN